MHSFTDVCTYSKQGVGLEDYQDNPGIDPHIVSSYKISNRIGIVTLAPWH